MTTPRIEEIAREISDCVYYDRQDEVVHVDLEEIEGILRKLYRTAHQAGIDEAVALLKEKRNGHCGKKDCLQGYCINRKIIREFCDDTIKALQDNN